MIAWLALPVAWFRAWRSWLRNWDDAWIVPAVVTACLAVVVIVFTTLGTKKHAVFPRSWRSLGAFCLAWCLLQFAIWNLLVSSITMDLAMALLYVASTSWMFGLWSLRRLPVRWPSRGAILLAVCLPAWGMFGLVRATGLDGEGRPTLSWKHKPGSRMAGHAISTASRDRSARPTQSTSDEAAAARSTATDFPGFRGGDRLGLLRHAELISDWRGDAPREMWRIPVGAGWGGFAVRGQQACTQEQRGDDECLVCYDLISGDELWSRADRAHFLSFEVGDGPRATPTITADHVICQGATGILNCVDRQTGRRIWAVNILEDNHATSPAHGVCGSPLVVDDLVVVSPGGMHHESLAAYDLASGKRIWQAGTDPAGYGSAMLATLAGQRQILILNAPGVSAHDPQTGRILWTHPWENSVRTNCSQPVPLDDASLLVTSGYGQGSTRLRVSRSAARTFRVETTWTSRGLRTKFSSAVALDGFAYGLDDGILACVDLANGQTRWKQGRYGHGQILLARELLLIQAESGDVVLVRARPDRHQELARIHALHGKTWNTHALAGRYLLVRNDHEAACWRLPCAPGGNAP